MKSVSGGPVPLLLTTLLFASLNGLTACGGGGAAFAPPATYTLSVTPQPISIPVNGSMTFTATTNDPQAGKNVYWALVGSGGNQGSPSTANGLTFTYTAPPTPPVFEGTTPPAGNVSIRATELGGWMGTTVQFNIVITAPTITTGFLSTLNTVVLGQTLSIDAYAVGSTDNAITMQVNGTTGGSPAYGTITSMGEYGQYAYTAPARMPMSGNTVTVTVISKADPTKSSSMTITLTS